MNNDSHCVGQRLTGVEWCGLPMGRFAPKGHAVSLPVAARQDTLFVWSDGASAATVRSSRGLQHYQRCRGVMDLMGVGEEVYIQHDNPACPGECLWVAMPAPLREALGHRPFTGAPECLPSRFDLRDERLLSLVEALDLHRRMGEPKGRLFTASISSALVAHVMVHYGVEAPAATASTTERLSQEHQARLVGYIDEHLACDIALDDLVHLVGLTRLQFLRQFRSTFGLSPYQYVIQRRVCRARELLRGTRIPLVEIAMQCGFSGQPHFTAAFSKRVGLTPGRYRKEP